ncbi:hyaluronidase-1 [Pseudorasbora parva]|uniref:hyaluronidase-1 n=1 Tax=Pseudorasbora parva TaxID=51549 RepID=UPI00351E6B21
MGEIGRRTCLLLVFGISSVFGRPSSLLTHLPFFSVWNAPTERCTSQFGVELDLSVFDIVHNRDQAFMGDNITIFYSDKLGEYPYYARYSKPVYGGVPQNGSLKQHLWKAYGDLRADIPNRDFHGLAVVDWEKWRPLWERNWDTKAVYWKGSKSLVKAKHPNWNPGQIETEAVREFEDASRAFMEETLKLGRRERPGGLWGFYGFPGCYNYQYKKNGTYTGECPALEMKRNDKLAWLWNVSSALYPDIYLDLGLRGRGQDILMYSRHRILEAMRVREQSSHQPPPVFPYARIAYTYSMVFLSQEDLVHTIGESVALGASGIVLWGDGNYSKTKTACEEVQQYLDGTLGHYIVNVTEAAFLCSRTVCSSQGRCVRKDWSGSAHLHLDPAEWTIIPRAGRPAPITAGPSYVAQRRLRTAGDEARGFTDKFRCQCFPGWGGEQCQKPVPGETFT